jgi:redox-sensitive bicupin YhaK (pirin superfamily)
MSVRVISVGSQAYGAFNNGQIVENKPIGFPQDGGFIRPYSNLFYWAKAKAVVDSTIALHPHQGFEIMSFVLQGKIKHFDTKMNDWKELNKGDVQIIRSGNGISHAEHMTKDSVMFQIWLDPNLVKTLEQDASYSDYKSSSFPVEENNSISIKTYIGKKGPVELDTSPLKITNWSFEDVDETQNLDKEKIYSIYVLNGNAVINDNTVESDDFIILEDESELRLGGSAEFFVIEGPKKLDYPTYDEIIQRRMNN